MCLGTVAPVLSQKQNRRIDNSVEKTFHRKQAMIERKQRQRIHSRFEPKAKPLDATPELIAPEIDIYVPRLTRSQTRTKSPKPAPRVTPSQTYTQPPKTIIPVKNISPKKQPLATSNESMFYTETLTLPNGQKINLLRRVGYQQPTVDRSKSGNDMIAELIRSSKPAPTVIDLTE